MKIVQRGNKQLRVSDDRLDDMLKAGYSEIDQKTGKPIEVDSPEAKTEKALKKENAALKKENEALKQQVSDLTERLKVATQSE